MTDGFRMTATLVTGGAGYIGSHTLLALIAAGFQPVVFDNLSNGRAESVRRVERLTGQPIPFIEGDIRDTERVVQTINAHRITSVIHFAALKAVGDSVAKPLAYYENNVGGTLSLLQAMAATGVKTLVFSSSATVYGDPDFSPIPESAALRPASPYGQTKVMCEQIICDSAVAAGDIKVALLRYFNPVGAHASGAIGEDPNGVPNNLLPYITQVAVGRLAKLRIYGNDYPTIDGTGVRDYIHVMDLAEGHAAALTYLERVAPSVLTLNLGTSRGSSVLEVIAAFERASGVSIPREFVARRAGDVPEYFADATAAKGILGWSPSRSLDDVCRDAWHWQSRNPNGYDS
jgi:UDP-glucose 4-epimerase